MNENSEKIYIRKEINFITLCFELIILISQ